MKTDPGLFPLFHKFKKNPKKQYKWKFRVYPSCLYSRLDRWLNRMSLSGWHIVDIKLGFFCSSKVNRRINTISAIRRHLPAMTVLPSVFR